MNILNIHKLLFIIPILLLITNKNLRAQVGINTINPDPSAMLDIDVNDQGIIIPQISLINSTDIVTVNDPEISLLVFNTTNVNDITIGYRYWNGVRWVPFIVDEVQTVRYSNTNHSSGSTGNRTNLNQSEGIKAPIFGLLEWNDNSSLFSINTNTHELTVNEAGSYRIEFSLLYTADTANQALNAQLLINDIPTGPIAASGFINGPNFGQTDNQNANVSLTTVLNLSTNDIISINVAGDTNNTGAIYLTNPGSSTITITRLK